MLVCLDVDYRRHDVVAACVGFEGWAAAVPSFELAARVGGAPADYVPGSFYLRELPHLLRILEIAERERRVRPEVVLIDGYVSLGPDRPGLGEHLHRALGGRTPVVGVAKTAFRGAVHATAVKRGTSERPLYVTAIGIAQSEAAAGVEAMHGAHRVPTMLRRVDRACREWRGRSSPARVL
ncbi:MAG TPA: endonuclease V [Polyangiaceae bacterium]|nr:endonuclease V [Polyangiaceae bacterium]